MIKSVTRALRGVLPQCNEHCSQQRLDGDASSREVPIRRSQILFQWALIISLRLTSPTHHGATSAAKVMRDFGLAVNPCSQVQATSPSKARTSATCDANSCQKMTIDIVARTCVSQLLFGPGNSLICECSSRKVLMGLLQCPPLLLM